MNDLDEMTGGFWYLSTSILSCPDALLGGKRENGDGAVLYVSIFLLKHVTNPAFIGFPASEMNF